MSKVRAEKNNSNSSYVNGYDRGQGVDVEVVPLAKRRQFSASYKERILAEADACSKPGEIGALLRREGLYSSYLTSWRRERAREQRWVSKKRGRKGQSAQEKELTQLKTENARLKAQLERAETIIDVQKKVSQLFGQPIDETKQDGAK